jgi:hypothetical protein
VQVTPIGTSLTSCNVVRWNNSGNGLQAIIECRNRAGQFVDSRYEVLVIE